MERLIWFFALVSVGLFAAVGGFITSFCRAMLAISRKRGTSLLVTTIARPEQFEEPKRWLVGLRNRAYWTLFACAILFAMIVIIGGSRGFETGAP